MEKGDNNMKHVIIIGAGLVGSLCACFMAKRGYKVDIYEYREDIRKLKAAEGRSINLALSNRGRKALRYVGLEDVILTHALPMKGRLIHSLSGETKSILYDARTKQCINSVGRNLLNKTLLAELDKYAHVNIHFKHKLVNANLDEGSVSVLNLASNEIIKSEADLIIGADGAFSALRKVMQQRTVFDFSQKYIEHGYMELSIPSERGTKMVPNHLHIWPRGEFMMIALPNEDTSWTVTLFMQFEKFRSLSTHDSLVQFFKTTFPDAVPLIGEDDLAETFFSSKPMPLVSVKCDPYHAGGRFLLIGDAAHAMVPFFGQGMNAGFEDCSLLNEILETHHDNIERSIEEFTLKRREDSHAICDLAVYNYMEMRDLVTKTSYRMRKFFDDWLFKILPDVWIPLYNSVTFSHMGYSECILNRKWQDDVLKKTLWALAILFLSFCIYIYIN